MATFQERRIELHNKLTTLLGSRPVYFQPPRNKQLTYPCVIYSFDGKNSDFANNREYRSKLSFQIVYITTDPDSQVPFEINNILEYCTMGKRYEVDGLYHTPLDCSII